MCDEFFNIESVGIYNSQITKPHTVVSKIRKTSAFELELAIENGGISYINSKSHSIEKGLVILAKPGQARHTKFPYKCYYVHFFVNDEYFFERFMRCSDFIEISSSETYEEIFTQLCKIYQSSDKTDILILNSLFLKLLYMIVKAPLNTDNTVRKRTNDKIIKKSLIYIEKNLCSDLNLSIIASNAGFSPNYFHNIFKAATGKTLRIYIEERKIEKSISLLRITDKTLTEIAYECGFSSQSYYSYVFKRKTGLTPREYVKKLNSQYEI